jgi:hypothetical protein
MLDFNPETHVRGEDGKIYERRIVAATGVAVGMHVETKSQTAFQAAMVKAQEEAIRKAHAKGLTDPGHLKEQMAIARAKVENDHYGSDDGA